MAPAPRVSVLPGDGLNFARFAPDAGLAGFVESYWTLDVERPPVELTALPDGLTDLIFVLGARPAGYAAGPLTRPETYRHERRVSLLGVSLQPGTAVAVLGIEAVSLPAGWTPLAELAGPAADELAARLAAAGPVQARLAILDTFLAARLRGAATDGRVSTALNTILDRSGDVAVERLAHESAASPRNLGRLFDAWVGINPKRFARIVRVQAALRVLMEEPGTDLTGLAARLGFADHAHLTREIRTLAGAPPSELARRLHRDDPAVSFKRDDGAGP
ncbi:helix-turn-helix domain-containing protein [Actinoplanes sp. NPDC026623]|uniref:helix-turn-helix domain-containing protein n=1 Tax=Actinoplanes sp. NPDC026623 TaxID=3155610 RepID=UPI0033F5C4D2